MTRFRMYYDKDRAVSWLNEMSAHGWACTGNAAGFYTFEPCTPGAYDYQIDFAGGAPLSPDYRAFLEDLHIQVISKWGPWLTLRRPASDEPFSLYSDPESKIHELTRMRTFFKTMAVVEFICMALLLLGGEAIDAFWPYIFVTIAGIAAFAMVRRATQISDEIDSLSQSSGGPQPERRLLNVSRLLMVAGFIFLMVGMLLQSENPGGTADFIRGFGVGLTGVGILISLFVSWPKSRNT